MAERPVYAKKISTVFLQSNHFRCACPLRHIALQGIQWRKLTRKNTGGCVILRVVRYLQRSRLTSVFALPMRASRPFPELPFYGGLALLYVV